MSWVCTCGQENTDPGLPCMSCDQWPPYETEQQSASKNSRAGIIADDPEDLINSGLDPAEPYHREPLESGSKWSPAKKLKGLFRRKDNDSPPASLQQVDEYISRRGNDHEYRRKSWDADPPHPSQARSSSPNAPQSYPSPDSEPPVPDQYLPHESSSEWLDGDSEQPVAQTSSEEWQSLTQNPAAEEDLRWISGDRALGEQMAEVSPYRDSTVPWWERPLDEDSAGSMGPERPVEMTEMGGVTGYMTPEGYASQPEVGWADASPDVLGQPHWADVQPDPYPQSSWAEEYLAPADAGSPPVDADPWTTTAADSSDDYEASEWGLYGTDAESVDAWGLGDGQSGWEEWESNFVGPGEIAAIEPDPPHSEGSREWWELDDDPQPRSESSDEYGSSVLPLGEHSGQESSLGEYEDFGTTAWDPLHAYPPPQDPTGGIVPASIDFDFSSGEAWAEITGGTLDDVLPERQTTEESFSEPERGPVLGDFDFGDQIDLVESLRKSLKEDGEDDHEVFTDFDSEYEANDTAVFGEFSNGGEQTANEEADSGTKDEWEQREQPERLAQSGQPDEPEEMELPASTRRTFHFSLAEVDEPAEPEPELSAEEQREKSKWEAKLDELFGEYEQSDVEESEDSASEAPVLERSEEVDDAAATEEELETLEEAEGVVDLETSNSEPQADTETTTPLISFNWTPRERISLPEQEEQTEEEWPDALHDEGEANGEAGSETGDLEFDQTPDQIDEQGQTPDQADREDEEDAAEADGAPEMLSWWEVDDEPDVGSRREENQQSKAVSTDGLHVGASTSVSSPAMSPLEAAVPGEVQAIDVPLNPDDFVRGQPVWPEFDRRQDNLASAQRRHNDVGFGDPAALVLSWPYPSDFDWNTLKPPSSTQTTTAQELLVPSFVDTTPQGAPEAENTGFGAGAELVDAATSSANTKDQVEKSTEEQPMDPIASQVEALSEVNRIGKILEETVATGSVRAVGYVGLPEPGSPVASPSGLDAEIAEASDRQSEWEALKGVLGENVASSDPTKQHNLNALIPSALEQKPSENEDDPWAMYDTDVEPPHAESQHEQSQRTPGSQASEDSTTGWTAGDVTSYGATPPGGADPREIPHAWLGLPQPSIAEELPQPLPPNFTAPTGSNTPPLVEPQEAAELPPRERLENPRFAQPVPEDLPDQDLTVDEDGNVASPEEFYFGSPSSTPEVESSPEVDSSSSPASMSAAEADAWWQGADHDAWAESQGATNASAANAAQPGAPVNPAEGQPYDHNWAQWLADSREVTSVSTAGTAPEFAGETPADEWGRTSAVGVPESFPAPEFSLDTPVENEQAIDEFFKEWAEDPLASSDTPDAVPWWEADARADSAPGSDPAGGESHYTQDPYADPYAPDHAAASAHAPTNWSTQGPVSEYADGESHPSYGHSVPVQQVNAPLYDEYANDPYAREVHEASQRYDEYRDHGRGDPRDYRDSRDSRGPRDRQGMHRDDQYGYDDRYRDDRDDRDGRYRQEYRDDRDHRRGHHDYDDRYRDDRDHRGHREQRDYRDDRGGRNRYREGPDDDYDYDDDWEFEEEDAIQVRPRSRSRSGEKPAKAAKTTVHPMIVIGVVLAIILIVFALRGLFQNAGATESAPRPTLACRAVDTEPRDLSALAVSSTNGWERKVDPAQLDGPMTASRALASEPIVSAQQSLLEKNRFVTGYDWTYENAENTLLNFAVLQFGSDVCAASYVTGLGGTALAADVVNVREQAGVSAATVVLEGSTQIRVASVGPYVVRVSATPPAQPAKKAETFTKSVVGLWIEQAKSLTAGL